MIRRSIAGYVPYRTFRQVRVRARRRRRATALPLPLKKIFCRRRLASARLYRPRLATVGIHSALARANAALSATGARTLNATSRARVSATSSAGSVPALRASEGGTAPVSAAMPIPRPHATRSGVEGARVERGGHREEAHHHQRAGDVHRLPDHQLAPRVVLVVDANEARERPSSACVSADTAGHRAAPSVAGDAAERDKRHRGHRLAREHEREVRAETSPARVPAPCSIMRRCSQTTAVATAGPTAKPTFCAATALRGRGLRRRVVFVAPLAGTRVDDEARQRARDERDEGGLRRSKRARESRRDGASFRAGGVGSLEALEGPARWAARRLTRRRGRRRGARSSRASPPSPSRRARRRRLARIPSRRASRSSPASGPRPASRRFVRG